MNTQKTTFLILIAILLAGNIFFGMQYVGARQALQETQSSLTAQRTNERTLAFTQLFVEKVLQSEGEVDFETRLLLENSVRAIGDEEILSQWRRFTEANTEEEAQREVKGLLGILVEKIEM